MYVHREEDLKYLDSFHLPTFLDPSVDDYKEWYHFIFYDKANDLFGFLNFSLVGNPYNSRKGVGGALIFLQNSRGEWRGCLDLVDSADIRTSQISPSFLSGSSAVLFEDNKYFHLIGKTSNPRLEFDLTFTPDALPVSTKGPGLGVFGATPDGRSEIDPIRVMKKGIGKIAEGWVSIPRNIVSGYLTVDSQDIMISKAIGYHDHNWGAFPWGDPFGWDGGVVLSDVMLDTEPIVIGFLFDRSPFAVAGREGGLFVRTRRGFKRIFSRDNVKIKYDGVYLGSIRRLPGLEQLLYPDYHPRFPKSVSVSADDGIDSVNLSYAPSSLCQLTTRERSNKAKTVWNESFGKATLSGMISGVDFSGELGFWMENVRSSK